jgi:hypothetical protein
MKDKPAIPTRPITAPGAGSSEKWQRFIEKYQTLPFCWMAAGKRIM